MADNKKDSGIKKVEQGKGVRIMIPASAEESEDVVLGHNGDTIRIQRGKEVIIHEDFLDVLKNAVMTIYRKKDTDTELTKVEVPRFPFQVLGKV